MDTKRRVRKERTPVGTYKACSVCGKQFYIGLSQEGYVYKARKGRGITRYQCGYTHWKQFTDGIVDKRDRIHPNEFLTKEQIKQIRDEAE